MTHRWSWPGTTAGLVAVLVVACGTPAGTDEGTAATAVLTAPGAGGGTVERPIQDAQLEPGTRYRFEDVPQLPQIELTGPEPPLYSYTDTGLVALSPDADFVTDSLYLVNPDFLRVPNDPFLALGDLAGDADLSRSTSAAPTNLLAYAAQSPFVEVTAQERPFTVAGTEGRAVDLRVRELPIEAQRCGQEAGLPACVVLFIPSGSAPLAQSGQALRLVVLELSRDRRVLVYQNLDLPQGQALLDSLVFVDA